MSKEKKVSDQRTLSAKALALKNAADTEAAHPATNDQPNEGMQSTPRTDLAPSGAFGAEGERPVLERSRKVR